MLTRNPHLLQPTRVYYQHCTISTPITARLVVCGFDTRSSAIDKFKPVLAAVSAHARSARPHSPQPVDEGGGGSVGGLHPWGRSIQDGYAASVEARGHKGRDLRGLGARVPICFI